MSKHRRKAIPKKIRFEVFKRDKFTCQYCGKKAPDVILHVDHIDPVSKGGENEIINFVTACLDCNLGKGATLLSDDSAVEMQRRQLENSQDRTEQLEMMHQWRKDLVVSAERELEMVIDLLYAPSYMQGWMASEHGHSVLRKFLHRFGISRMMDAIEIAHAQYIKIDENGRATKESIETVFDKIGGICWNRKNRDNL
ncbi:MAG: HNH endonuclease [Planctomycetota bacterium]|nr:HNH endonuclease [Planctomycetota bacterium]